MEWRTGTEDGCGSTSSATTPGGEHEGHLPGDNTSLTSLIGSNRLDTTMLEEQDRSELLRIATALLQRQRQHNLGQPGSIYLKNLGAGNSAALDPTSKSFDLSRWLQGVMKQMHKEGMHNAVAGVAYRDLDVFGAGTPVGVQQTVSSTFLAPWRGGWPFRPSRKGPTKILRSVDGLLKNGELLIVLGRPGSGCSTLLRTIAGELRGLSLGRSSVIQYNGISQGQMASEFKGEAVYNQDVSPKVPHLQVMKCPLT